MLETEFKFFIDNQKDLVKKYSKKFIVVKGEAVVGVFDSLAEAYDDSTAKYDLGTFLIQQCLPGDSAHKQVFNSRAVFS